MSLSMKDKALDLARQGFVVFPLTPNSKKPLPGSAGFKDATDAEFQIEEWWNEHPDANIGISPDASNPRLLIVDVDAKKGGGETYGRLQDKGVLPAHTFIVATPSGGFHLYYALAPDAPKVQSSVEKLGKGIDVRSHGGYVVAPGSSIGGKVYKVIDSRSPSIAMQGLIQACGRAEERHSGADKWLVEPDLPVNVEKTAEWLKTTEPAIEGSGGHDHTYKTAAMARDRGISAPKTLELMEKHWNPRCSPSWEPDQLAQIIENAHTYNKRPAGCEAYSRKASALQEAKTAASEKVPPTRRPYRPITMEELSKRPPSQWLVDEVFPETGLGELLGATGTYKSFLALDLALHVAHGLPWMGFKTIQRPVVYVAGEGSAGIRNRVKAWLIQHDIKENPMNFYLVETMPSFSSPEEYLTLVQEIAPVKPGLVILDTLARAIPGMDENSAKDIGTFVHAADKIWQGLGCFILYLHHTGKDESKGSRGSTAGPAALDVQLTVTSDPEVLEAFVRMTKGKDVEVWPDRRLFKGHRVSLDNEGLKPSLAFTYEGVRKAGAYDDVSRASRLSAVYEALEGKTASEALTTNELARVVARATTADESWPEEGPVQDKLVANVSKWIRRTFAASPEGQACLLNPGDAVLGARGGVDLLWYDNVSKERQE